ncbi:MAG: RNA polymerase sigma factor [bacterium]
MNSESNISSADARQADFDLLDRCLSGDRTAREDLAVRISKMIYWLAWEKAPKIGLRLTREDADDLNQEILQDLFANKCSQLRGFGRRSSLQSWIKVIVTNALIDIKRSAHQRHVENSVSLQAPASNDPDARAWEDVIADLISNPSEQLLYKSLVESIRSAAEEVLSVRDKAIVAMWASKQYSTDEMAVFFGLSGGGVGTIIHRSLLKIARYMQEKEEQSV